MFSAASTLKLGEIVIAEVVEIQSDHHLLVAIEGRLLRVMNSSNQSFPVGAALRLSVQSVDPLRMQIYNGEKNGIDRVI